MNTLQSKVEKYTYIKWLLGALFVFNVFLLSFLFINKSFSPVGKPYQANENLDVQIIADNLFVPWDFVFLPDNTILITERNGVITHVANKKKRKIHTAQTYSRGEGGLLGIALHPNFVNNKWVYLYYTVNIHTSGTTINKIERYVYNNAQLTEPTIILSNIPGAKYHDGGRIVFGPDNYLYITTGDAGSPKLAQDIQSLSGKILRIHDDGTIPTDNPFIDSPVYSYGHRNPQGLTWDTDGNLWSTEHGRSGFRSGFDEINLITAGSNYGWPNSQGDTVLEGTVGPLLHSGTATWAPASAVFYEGSIYFGGLRGETLYEAVLDGKSIKTLKKHYYKRFGRIRTVKTNRDGTLYFTTSNKDGRGNPRDRDDKLFYIIK